MSFSQAIGMGLGSLAGQAFGGGNKAPSWNKRLTKKFHKDHMKLARDAATKSVRWRVWDARAAGIHPGLALGISPSSGAASAVGVPSSGASGANWASQIGQDVGAAVGARLTKSERAYSEQLQAEQLKTARLNNAYIAEQIAASQAARRATNPPVPSVRDGLSAVSTDLVRSNPLERVAGVGPQGSQEPGPVSATGFLSTGTGLSPVKSTDAADRLEDDIIGNAVHAGRRYVGPLMGYGKPSKSLLPEGYNDWRWNFAAFEWQPTRRGPSRPRNRRQWRHGNR